MYVDLLINMMYFIQKSNFYQEHQHLFRRHHILIYNIDIYNTIPVPETFHIKMFIVILKECIIKS